MSDNTLYPSLIMSLEFGNWQRGGPRIKQHLREAGRTILDEEGNEYSMFTLTEKARLTQNLKVFWEIFENVIKPRGVDWQSTPEEEETFLATVKPTEFVGEVYDNLQHAVKEQLHNEEITNWIKMLPLDSNEYSSRPVPQDAWSES